MKTLNVPPPVTVTDVFGNEIRTEKGALFIMDLKTFLLGRLVDPIFYEGKNGAEAAMLVLATKLRLDSSTFGETIELEDEQWERFCKAAKTPTGGYDGRFQHVLVPYIQAILEAK